MTRVDGEVGAVVEAPDRSGLVLLEDRDALMGGPRVWIPEEQAPDWIGPEEDLPI